MIREGEGRAGEAPIVVAGMHRSGTSVVSRALESVGVFMGATQDPNGEALYFQEINRWVVRQSGGAWDRPRPVVEFLRIPEYLAVVVDRVRARLRCLSDSSYVREGRRWLRPAPGRPDGPWGWKDPRNTLTLPLWHRLYPRARVVWVTRNGVDVAASLLARNRRLLARRRDEETTSPARELPRLWLSGRCRDLEASFTLWEEYMEIGRSWIDDEREGAGIRTVSFEEMMARPLEELGSLVDFCGAEAPDGALEQIVGRLYRKRAEAYRDDPELVTFARRHRDRLARFGYG